MTIVVSSNGSDRLIPGAVVVGVRGLGVKGSTIPSTGTDGPSPVYASLSLPADANKEYRFKLVTAAYPGSMTIAESTGVSITGLTDGNNFFVVKLYENGVDIGDITTSMLIGSSPGVQAVLVGVESAAAEVGGVSVALGPSPPVTVTLTGVESGAAEAGAVNAAIGDVPPPVEEPPGENMRIVHDNAVDRSVSVTASSTAGALAASNLLTDFKTEVWRSTGTTATLEFTWATTETFSMFALPFSNLSSTATMRVQSYTLAGDTAPAADTGPILCCPVSLGFSAPWATAGANTFAYGGGVYAAIWFAPRDAQKIVVTITDTANPSGYVEAARAVAGKYWSPERNVEWESPKMTVQEDSKQERSDAGTLWTDRGPVYRKLSFDLSIMSASDRNVMWKILRANGMSRPIYVCIWPEQDDAYDEQIYSIYGKLSNSSTLQYKFLDMHATSVVMEEI